MLVYPKTILELWTDYHSIATDVDALVGAATGGSGELSAGKMDLRRMLDLGFTHTWTLRHAEAAADRLEDWCVRNGRYFCNVAIPQSVVDPATFRWPRLVEPKRWELWVDKSSTVIAGYRIKPFGSQDRNDGDLILLDAPVCVEVEGLPHSEYLCDVPPFVRNNDDQQVPLILSEAVRGKLKAYASDGTNWMPFFRTLGIVRRQSRGLAVEVLRQSARLPKICEGGWFARLIAEAREMKSQTAITQAQFWLGVYREDVKRTREKYTDQTNVTANRDSELARELQHLSSTFVNSHLRNPNNPFDGAEGFWTAAASILPAWRDRLQLTGQQVTTLLKEFDATYDQEWTALAKDLALSGLLRFTPDAVARIRAQLASSSRG